MPLASEFLPALSGKPSHCLGGTFVYILTTTGLIGQRCVRLRCLMWLMRGTFGLASEAAATGKRITLSHKLAFLDRGLSVQRLKVPEWDTAIGRICTRHKRFFCRAS